MTFDERINKIAEYAKFVLHPDMMQLLRHTASLSHDEITLAMQEIKKKRWR